MRFGNRLRPLRPVLSLLDFSQYPSQTLAYAAANPKGCDIRSLALCSYGHLRAWSMPLLSTGSTAVKPHDPVRDVTRHTSAASLRPR